MFPILSPIKAWLDIGVQHRCLRACRPKINQFDPGTSSTMGANLGWCGKKGPEREALGCEWQGLFSPCCMEDSMGMFVVNVHFMKKKLQVVLCGKVIANVMEAILIISESLNVERKTIVASSEMCLEQWRALLHSEWMNSKYQLGPLAAMSSTSVWLAFVGQDTINKSGTSSRQGQGDVRAEYKQIYQAQGCHRLGQLYKWDTNFLPPGLTQPEALSIAVR